MACKNTGSTSGSAAQGGRYAVMVAAVTAEGMEAAARVAARVAATRAAARAAAVTEAVMEVGARAVEARAVEASGGKGGGEGGRRRRAGCWRGRWMEARAEVAARVAVEREEAEVEAARLAVRAGAATVEAMAVEVTVEAVSEGGGGEGGHRWAAARSLCNPGPPRKCCAGGADAVPSSRIITRCSSPQIFRKQTAMLRLLLAFAVCITPGAALNVGSLPLARPVATGPRAALIVCEEKVVKKGAQGRKRKSYEERLKGPQKAFLGRDPRVCKVSLL